MKHLLKIALLAVIVACGTGCTTGYWMNRGRDAVDVFTCTVGVGGGIQARVGPLSQGLGMNLNVAGLQNGCVFGPEEGNGFDCAFLVYSFHAGGETSMSEMRNKAYKGTHLLGVAVPFSLDGEAEYTLAYFTQIEVYIGLGGTVKLGFNPGELLDFLLGFAGIDIYNDDLERRKQEIEQGFSACGRP